MYKILIITLTTLISLNYATYVEYDGWLNIELYHALDINRPDQYTLRGNVSVTSLNTGTVSASQEPLSTDDRNKFKILAEQNKLYRLKAIVINSDGKKSQFLTSSRACALAKSQLMDVLWISLDHIGSVIGVSQTVSGSSDCTGIKITDTDGLEEFNTDVYVKHMELAPIPDTASFVQKIERERDARERGEVKDNRGFFAKYWMYIVPVAILVLISGATNPAQDGGAAR